MKTLLILLLSTASFAQQTFSVKDRSTDVPIAYTFIYNEDKTFKINAESDGTFQVPDDYLNDIFTFESVGYELKHSKLETTIIFLEESSNLLDELVIIPKLNTKEIMVGNKIIKKYSDFVFAEENPFSVMIFGIKCNVNKDAYSNVKKIHLKTKSNINDAKFEIRIYGAGDDGKPSDLLHYEPIYGIAKKGVSTTIVDVHELNIQIPSDDFFVFYKPLYIEKNSYMLKEHGIEKKYYYPNILMSSVDSSFMWMGIKTKNEQFWDSYHLKEDGEYLNYQIEVFLTN
ncbi:hypothetical protein H1R17_05125 [Flavobacterium sp. xlx-214]|uniref:hypothetical protein n=1 Tax=unclassified Flavobacterium TaxID=196869 RepID=UPI0013D5169D|nr:MULTISPECIES: hypothetical protein [unclassified Flavobacterium]MBA5793584.1 hypothetical protein [Flavobacterium sp. xlx-221]QMI84514.1 hypothetical protein H1R17_05125 [Flavobacterium sp. xlx-214]